MKNKLTFTEAKGKYLAGSFSKLRCDEPSQLEHWMTYTVKDGEIVFDEEFNTYRVISEEMAKAESLVRECINNWNGTLD